MGTLSAPLVVKWSGLRTLRRCRLLLSAPTESSRFERIGVASRGLEPVIAQELANDWQTVFGCERCRFQTQTGTRVRRSRHVRLRGGDLGRCDRSATGSLIAT